MPKWGASQLLGMNIRSQKQQSASSACAISQQSERLVKNFNHRFAILRRVYFKFPMELLFHFEIERSRGNWSSLDALTR
jgi:hypothetical protein